MFKFNFIQAILTAVPHALRKPKLLSWLYVFIKPLGRLYDAFIAYRDAKLFYVTHNSQVLSLNDVLKSTIDDGVFVDDPVFYEAYHIYMNREQRAPVYLYKDTESSPATIHLAQELNWNTSFTVYVPQEILFNESKLRAQVERFKLAGKSWNMKEYVDLVKVRWTEPVCVANFEDFNIRWSDKQCSLTGLQWSVQWSDRQCVQSDGAYSIQWSNKYCVHLDTQYSIKWQQRECVLSTDAVYSLQWSDQQCVLEYVDLYNVQWSSQQCVLQDISFNLKWTNQQCVLTSFDYNVQWSGQQCVLYQNTFFIRWSGKECVLESSTKTKN